MDDSNIDELLRSLGSREPQEAWAQFLEAYAPVILQTVRFMERGEDAVADCFLSVCEGLARDRFHRLRQFNLAGPARFSTWLRVVARNLSVDWRRRKFGRHRSFESVNRLSALEQELFHCLYVEGCSQEEAFLRMSPKFPGLSKHALEESAEHILQELSPRQRWLLSARRTAHLEDAGDAGDALETVADQRPSPESAAVSEQYRGRLQQSLACLSQDERLLLQLRFEQELTLDQVARLMHLGDAQRADRTIRELLARLRADLDRVKPKAAEKLGARP